jgi:hypothetical protein
MVVKLESRMHQVADEHLRQDWSASNWTT